MSYATRGASAPPLRIRVRRLAGSLARSDWRLEPGDELSVSGGLVTHYEHLFAPGELEAEASAAGLEVVQRFDRGVAALVLAR